MKYDLRTLIAIVMAIIILGAIAVAILGMVKWLLDNFWIIFLTGAVIFAVVIWLKHASGSGEQGDGGV